LTFATVRVAHRAAVVVAAAPSEQVVLTGPRAVIDPAKLAVLIRWRVVNLRISVSREGVSVRPIALIVAAVVSAAWARFQQIVVTTRAGTIVPRLPQVLRGAVSGPRLQVVVVDPGPGLVIPRARLGPLFSGR
jgi:hypothetical protein